MSVRLQVVEQRPVEMEANKRLPLLADRQQFHLAATIQREAPADRRAAATAKQRAPFPTRNLFQKKYFRSSTRAGFPCEQAGRQHPRIIKDQQIARS